ncbi:related to cytosolic Cu/Zn superoxide dismutase [Cephalotrichum gorgonifer]|uniref:superoxide dismutase n=1 Tax=Cephalotrichum gorgonifer TaxID=2041049 RepID=A0AAE8SRA8_9PEZI|nr:related to cytosolic Cu/Zn superoxide dismutase [Cephalotrichum gorgonifer]
MLYQSLLVAALSAAAVEAKGERGDATPVNNNPVGVSYVATLPDTPFFAGVDIEGNVKGSISATSGADGKGVDFKVKFSNLPSGGGPFTYHLHSTPVPEDGNCTATLAHLDPFIRTDTPPCDPETPADCEVGDLSGKHGKVTSDPFELTFNDPYASLVEGLGSFFGNRSFVLHFANKTRITCANFELVTGGGDDDDCTDEGGHGDDDDDYGTPVTPSPEEPATNGTAPPTEEPETPGEPVIPDEPSTTGDAAAPPP